MAIDPGSRIRAFSFQILKILGLMVWGIGLGVGAQCAYYRILSLTRPTNDPVFVAPRDRSPTRNTEGRVCSVRLQIYGDFAEI